MFKTWFPTRLFIMFCLENAGAKTKNSLPIIHPVWQAARPIRSFWTASARSTRFESGCHRNVMRCWATSSTVSGGRFAKLPISCQGLIPTLSLFSILRQLALNITDDQLLNLQKTSLILPLNQQTWTIEALQKKWCPKTPVWSWKVLESNMLNETLMHVTEYLCDYDQQPDASWAEPWCFSIGRSASIDFVWRCLFVQTKCHNLSLVNLIFSKYWNQPG